MNCQYDLVFSMGAACACTECLRDADLQFSSFPFDWLAGSTLVSRMDILVDGCPDWLREDALEYLRPVSVAHTDAYRNTMTNIVFNHDFPQGVPLAESIGAVREKYDRRFARLKSLISRGGRVLAVYITPPPNGVPPSAEDAAYCRRRLAERFSNVVFDVLVLRHGENAEPFIEHPSDGVTLVTFDYHSRTDTTGANPVDRDRVVAFLRSTGFSARDYRTAAERRAHRAAERAKEYRRFGAKNPIEFFLAKCQYKLFVHLRKRLQRKGLA